MNAIEIETRAYQQIDYQPTQSTAFKALLRRMHNRARHTVYSDAPFLFEQVFKIVTQPDVVADSSKATDKLRVNSSDYYTMERVWNDSDNLAAWKFDNTWDGRWVEIKDPDDVWRRHQTREWWTAKSGVTNTDRFTLVNPWPNRTDTLLSYRVYTPEYHLPPSASEIKTARLYNVANGILDVRTKYEMERMGLMDYQGRTASKPSVLYKGEPFEIPAPTRAPSVASKGSGAWAVPENAGQFDACYTYVWGIIDPHDYTAGNIIVPRWESGPSPASDKFTTTNGGFPVTITVPDIAKELGFHDTSGLASIDRSGFRKRIYIRRYTSAVDGATPTLIDFIESHERFFEVTELTSGDMTFDFGGELLNKLKPLRQSHSYQSVGLYPIPDARYEVDIRATMEPTELIKDTDSTGINADVADCLVQKVLQHLYEWDGKPELGVLAERRYIKELEKLTKRYAGIAYDLQSKRLARVMRKGSTPRNRNVTWTGVT